MERRDNMGPIARSSIIATFIFLCLMPSARAQVDDDFAHFVMAAQEGFDRITTGKLVYTLDRSITDAWLDEQNLSPALAVLLEHQYELGQSPYNQKTRRTILRLKNEGSRIVELNFDKTSHSCRVMEFDRRGIESLIEQYELGSFGWANLNEVTATASEDDYLVEYRSSPRQLDITRRGQERFREEIGKVLSFLMPGYFGIEPGKTALASRENRDDVSIYVLRTARGLLELEAAEDGRILRATQSDDLGKRISHLYTFDDEVPAFPVSITKEVLNSDGGLLERMSIVFEKVDLNVPVESYDLTIDTTNVTTYLDLTNGLPGKGIHESLLTGARIVGEIVQTVTASSLPSSKNAATRGGAGRSVTCKSQEINRMCTLRLARVTGSEVVGTNCREVQSAFRMNGYSGGRIGLGST
jgi:hypothetical protein